MTAWAEVHPTKLQVEEVSNIFANIPLLHHLNSGMCTAIEEAVDKWAEKVLLFHESLPPPVS